MGDAHLHICLDGQEPRTSTVVGSPPLDYAGAMASDGRNDRDLDIAGGVTSGKIGSLDLWIIPVDVSLARPVAWSASISKLLMTAPLRLSWRLHLRPLLRGPPR